MHVKTHYKLHENTRVCYKDAIRVIRLNEFRLSHEFAWNTTYKPS